MLIGIEYGHLGMIMMGAHILLIDRSMAFQVHIVSQSAFFNLKLQSDICGLTHNTVRIKIPG